MNRDRRQKIRRAAALRCASELSAVTEDGPDSKTWDDWPDPQEREVFSAAVLRIVQRLYREGGQ